MNNINPFKNEAFLTIFICLVCINFNGACQEIPELQWEIEVLYDGDGFTEGPVLAADGSIYFSDMESSEILNYNLQTGKVSVWQDSSRTSNGLFINGNNLYACEAIGRAVTRYNIEKGPESRKVIVDKFNGKRFGSPNDITIVNDKLFFSEFFLGNRLRPLKAEREIFKNRVYIVSLSDNSIDTLKYEFKVPNGVASSPDGKTVYIGDIRSHLITKVSLKKGEVKNIKPFIDLSFMGKAGPDGMTVSKNGTVYIALFGGGKVVVIDKKGNALGYIVTGTRTTNCILSEDEDFLYVTSDGKLKKVVTQKF